jgi:fructose-1-phosphate kinase PfkB-like protein
VGSGDAALAAFAFASAQGWPPEESVRLAAACGAANCLAEGPGLARAEDIQGLRKQVRVKKLA